MSLFRRMNVSCPNCGTAVDMSAVGSVNADRRPDLREAILQSEFQDIECPSCRTGFRLSPDFNYLDVGRGQWIAGLSADRMSDWPELEDEARATFDGTYGSGATPAAGSIGAGLTVRVTFGWPAIREKILAREHDLDDALLEMVKMETMRRLPSAPFAAGIELRLVGVSDDTLTFSWIDAETEEVSQSLDVRRTLLDAIAENPEGWSKIRARLTDGPFVDMQKFYVGDARPA